jgi:hypothetical protein
MQAEFKCEQRGCYRIRNTGGRDRLELAGLSRFRLGGGAARTDVVCFPVFPCLLRLREQTQAAWSEAVPCVPFPKRQSC